MGCPYPDAPNGVGQCLHGVCSIVSCDDGYYNADGVAGNGCECQKTENGEELCDGVDNNCDGLTDEGCSCTPTNGGVEICDGVDNDCDHKVDEDLTCCPDDMVQISTGSSAFCMDIYEASRPDANEDNPGTQSGAAQSVPGVRPWVNLPQADAQTACELAGKRLCNPGEWFAACTGPNQSAYCYGDDYEAATCNGIDTFCPEPAYGCGLDLLHNQNSAVFHVTPTASFPDCTNAFGILDINGNIWEWDSSPEGHARGGAYNCSDSKKLHRCDYIRRDGNQAINNVGFRCCR